jgi:hypothetical protein
MSEKQRCSQILLNLSPGCLNLQLLMLIQLVWMLMWQ